MLLYDDARARRCCREVYVNAVNLLPIVHSVDQDLAGKEIGWKIAEAVHRNRQNNEVCVTNDLVVCDGSSPRGKHLDNEFDALDGTRPRDGNVISACNCCAGDRCADLSSSDDAKAKVGSFVAGHWTIL
jgi:hypothetical protein